ncbi:MAG: hypothetical protein L0229_06780 [Blastocatellia bacterium]|nr:hypothetical protein [Blastocatellia bacterium]
MPEQNDPHQPHIQAGLELPAEKKIYFNGFASAIGQGDTLIVLLEDNNPVALLHASHTIVKTLSLKLAEIINTLESKTGRPVLTTDEIVASLSQEQQ